MLGIGQANYRLWRTDRKLICINGVVAEKNILINITGKNTSVKEKKIYIYITGKNTKEATTTS